MRTISPELEALLRSRFQAASQGYAARFEVDALVPYVPPPVTWLHFSNFGSLDPQLSVEWSDDGSTWNVFADNATLAAGTTDPPNAPPGTYVGLVPISPEDDHHRYWRIHYEYEHPGGYYSGVDLIALRLLSSAYDTVDRLGCPVGTAEWFTPPTKPWTGDVTFSAGSEGGTLYGGAVAAGTPDIYSLSARQGEAQFGISSHVFGARPITASWTFDLGLDGLVVETRTYQPRRANLNKNLRMGPDQLTVELANADLALGFGPSSIFLTNSRCRMYQWYGDVADAVLTFTGVIDKITDGRDPLTTALTCRSLAGPILVDQTFSATAPQGADEEGAVRTEDNGVYLDCEVDYIVGDRMARAGWGLVYVSSTSFVLDEFIVEDGASEWDTLARLAVFVGYDQWDDEDGAYHFGTLGDAAAVDETLAPDYEYQVGITP